MKPFSLPICLALLLACSAGCGPREEVRRWEARAATVTISRDDWGVPHVRGATDADAVFGAIYAQAEDDFGRIETNYLNAMGRLAEAEGERAIWRDLRMKLFVDPDTMRARYAASPEWLRLLMDAWADGLNYYLHTHPDVTPRVLTRFEPWMALAFTEGSIGGDIERIPLEPLEAFYSRPAAVPGRAPLAAASGGGPAPAAPPDDPGGSNGIAIAPSRSASGNALLLINPHTSFYFRSELHMTSDEGLDAYGAVTWGQFFVYQGFNARAGWMHCSSGVDAVDEYAETIVARDSGFACRYGRSWRPVAEKRVTVSYRDSAGMSAREFRVLHTPHGPVVREADGRWIAVRLMQEPVKALMQSFSRTKAEGYADFRRFADLQANSSNNTVFADADGNIAYLHAGFVPRRDPRLDWSRPVDGADPATEWRGLHAFVETPNLLNPPTGWIQNTNNWPYSAAGPFSPRERDFPGYMDTAGENPRGRHALALLSTRDAFSLESLAEAAYDPHMAAFDSLLPALLAAVDRLPEADSLRLAVREAADTLRAWDRRWSVGSVATSLAVFWGEEMWRRVRAAPAGARLDPYRAMADRANARARAEALAATVAKLAADFGDWRTPWGEINRFQRLTGDLVPAFDDRAPSLPVGFTSGRWGSLASFVARPHGDTKRIYGTSGNSFVAVVEFGDTLRALAVTAGGLSGNPASKHFNDQAARYAEGNLREVYFHPWQLAGHVERSYRPGREPTSRAVRRWAEQAGRKDRAGSGR